MRRYNQAEEHRQDAAGVPGGEWDQWADGKISESGGGGGWSGGVCGATEAAAEMAGLDVWEHEGVEGASMSHSGSTDSFVKEEVFGPGDPRHWVGGSGSQDRSQDHDADAATPPMTSAHKRDLLISKIARFTQGPLSLGGSLAFLDSSVLEVPELFGFKLVTPSSAVMMGVNAAGGDEEAMVESLEAVAAKCDSASQALSACGDASAAAHQIGGVLLLVGSHRWCSARRGMPVDSRDEGSTCV